MIVKLHPASTLDRRIVHKRAQSVVYCTCARARRESEPPMPQGGPGEIWRSRKAGTPGRTKGGSRAIGHAAAEGQAAAIGNKKRDDGELGQGTLAQGALGLVTPSDKMAQDGLQTCMRTTANVRAAEI